MMRIAIGIFIAALAATPAMASEVARPDLARWVSDNTDMSATQIAIAEPDRVYSVEKLGPNTPTGEVIALVRAENLTANWAGPQGFASWDAHIIFDCKVDRMRVIRSASYPEPNRQGEPRADARLDDWFTPRPEEPSARLLAAACDSAYAWPLRAAPRAIAKAPSEPPIIEEGAPRSPAPEPAETPTENAPSAPTADDAAGAAKPAVELAAALIETPPMTTLEIARPVELAVTETLARPELAFQAAHEKRPAAMAASKVRLAGIFTPFAKVASLGKRLLTDGTRLAGIKQRRPAEQHATLGEEAAKRVANLARAGPDSD